ncbi:MAG: hypoxanthine phosphoribosyltransferase [Candidatus Bipolaricaulota bacterium]|nr:MAG: hypoxanthine phosphoribosyltransferase [Candidatus Bipolaricaulota bacterium]
MESDIESVLFSAEEIEARTRELGARISADYSDARITRDVAGRPPIVVCVLRGALLFMADLARSIPTQMEYDFICVASYGNGTSPGVVRLIKDLEGPIRGRDVLIVEDIVDTGHTLSYLRRGFDARDPASIRVCTLLDKPPRREVEVSVDYVGFTLTSNEFVVGYGMDYRGLYRNLPYIGVLRPEAIDA